MDVAWAIFSIIGLAALVVMMVLDAFGIPDQGDRHGT
jgi:hypothetical protein